MQISALGLRKKEEANISFVENPTYQWYFNIGLNSEYSQTFQLQYQQKLFDPFFWQSLKRIVNNNSFELFRSFVSTLHHGAHSTFISRNNIYSIFDISRVTVSAEKELSEIELRFLTTTSIKDYSDYSAAVSSVVTKYKTSLKKGVTTEEAINLLVSDACKNFKSTTLHIYIYLLGAYLVFKKKFDWINYLWEFQQPGDADATWGAHSFVPSDLPTIFRFLLNEDNYSNRVQFDWEEHHGVSSYYMKYGILLIARLYFIPKFYVYQDNIRSVHVLVSNINFKEYDHLIILCDDLTRHIAILDQFEKFRDKNVKETEQGEATPIKTAIFKLLESIKLTAREHQRNARVQREFTNHDLDAFLENINYNYKKENQISQIFEAIRPLPGVNLIDNTPLQFTKRIVKDEFIAQWEAYGANIGFEIARNLAWLFTTRIVKLLNNNEGVAAKNILGHKANEFFLSLPQVLDGWDKPVIIGLGINFNALLWQDKNFKALSSEDSSHKVGLYRVNDKDVDMYSISNWNYLNAFFIIDAKMFGDLQMVQPNNQDNHKTKDFIKVLFETRDDQPGPPQFLFQFTVFYQLRLITKPRAIRVQLQE